jgi:hypothetical protein
VIQKEMRLKGVHLRSRTSKAPTDVMQPSATHETPATKPLQVHIETLKTEADVEVKKQEVSIYLQSLIRPR